MSRKREKILKNDPFKTDFETIFRSNFRPFSRNFRNMSPFSRFWSSKVNNWTSFLLVLLVNKTEKKSAMGYIPSSLRKTKMINLEKSEI